MRHKRQPQVLALSGLSLVAGGLAILTIASPTWIEVLAGIDPDATSGWLEAGLALILAAAATVSALRAVAQMDRWRRPKRPLAEREGP